MKVDTVEDVVNDIADWLGCYGACKASEGADSCELSEEKIACCRVGFAMVMEDRIRKAVDNENKLKESGL